MGCCFMNGNYQQMQDFIQITFLSQILVLYTYLLYGNYTSMVLLNTSHKYSRFFIVLWPLTSCISLLLLS